MRALVVIVLLVAVAVLLGWVTFSRDDGRPSATVQTEVLKHDMHRAAKATERAAGKAAEKGEKLIDEARRTDIDVDVRRRPAPNTDPAPAGT